MQPDTLLLEFEYECNQSSLLEVYIGVANVEQHPTTEATTRIESKLFFSEEVSAGKKQKYRREVALGGYGGAENATLILRLMTLDGREKSEYSLRRVRQPSEHWKVLLEKLELEGVVTQLSNIFKGDASNECIICLSSPSDTLIEPCNHLCLCRDCLSSVQKSTNKCPICRKPIANFKVILSQS